MTKRKKSVILFKLARDEAPRKGGRGIEKGRRTLKTIQREKRAIKEEDSEDSEEFDRTESREA